MVLLGLSYNKTGHTCEMRESAHATAMASVARNDIRDPGARAEVTANARKVFIPPMPLSDAEFRQWEMIIERRAATEWERR